MSCVPISPRTQPPPCAKRMAALDLAPALRRHVFPQSHRPGRPGHGEIACLADFRRRDLRLSERAAIFLARGFRRKGPERRRRGRRRPIEQRLCFAIELQGVSVQGFFARPLAYSAVLRLVPQAGTKMRLQRPESQGQFSYRALSIPTLRPTKFLRTRDSLICSGKDSPLFSIHPRCTRSKVPLSMRHNGHSHSLLRRKVCKSLLRVVREPTLASEIRGEAPRRREKAPKDPRSDE